MNNLSCIGINIDQLRKEFVMIWRCIGHWLQKQLLHFIVREQKLYRPQPKDKYEWYIGREVLRGTLWEKEK